MRVLNTEIAIMTFDENERILHIQMIPGAEMTLDNTKEHYHLINQLTGGKEYIALVDASNYFIIDPEALKFAAEENTLVNRVAAAHYNSSVANLLTVSFFKNNLKPGIPVGIFKTKDDALEWIAKLNKEGIFDKIHLPS
ncbi:MAG: DUF7793 family protein [Bacteroidia bacterium]